MRTIELVPGIKSSALGFGCAPILGSVDAKRAQRALDCALDYGITHFDLARSYGYGEAERFVGKVIKSRRDHVVIATKFGIKANWKASLLSPLKPIIRIIKDARPKSSASSTGVVTTMADRFHDRIPFCGSEMRISLEQSLRALGTDYVDYLFVHEPQERLASIEELTATAQLLKKEGKIKAWGIAYMRAQQPIHKAYLNNFDIQQFDNSFGAQGYNEVVIERGVKPNVLFSPLRGGTEGIKPTEKLQKLVTDFPNSVVLCSMFSEKHIKENAALF